MMSTMIPNTHGSPLFVQEKRKTAHVQLKLLTFLLLPQILERLLSFSSLVFFGQGLERPANLKNERTSCAT
jgi:hypothetical protein